VNVNDPSIQSWCKRSGEQCTMGVTAK